MRPVLVVTCDANGVPVAAVSPGYLWELVESELAAYLSRRQAGASYRYEAGCLFIRFPQLDLVAAQRLLDDWAEAEVRISA